MREAFGQKSHQGDKWLKRQKKNLRKGRHDLVLTALRRLRPPRSVGNEKKTDAIRFLKNHREQMRYDEYEQAGLLIGSGSIESRCRRLVGTRFKGCGARRHKPSAQRLLSLRLAWQSGEWANIHPGVNPRSIKRHKAAWRRTRTIWTRHRKHGGFQASIRPQWISPCSRSKPWN